MIDTAVIMAAGKGTRFGSRTTAMPKGFIEFKGKSMIERSIENLLSVGIKRIIIGTGYHREWYEGLKTRYPQVVTVFSPVYADSNSMETLYRCRLAVGDRDFLLLESDLVYERKALTLLLEDSHKDIMLASDVMKFQDQYYIAVDEQLNLLKCSTDKEVLIDDTGEEPYGELVGIHRLSNSFYREMIKDYENHHNDYIKRGYEFEIEDVATLHKLVVPPDVTKDCARLTVTTRQTQQMPLYVLKPVGLQWYEIDDEEDLRFAEENIDINKETNLLLL